MLCLNRKTGYALISLAYLAEHADRVCSAREIARTFDLPLACLMNLLKKLHRSGIVRSVRGAKGGYQVDAKLESCTLYDLVALLEQRDRQGEVGGAKVAAVQALQFGLVRLLQNVKLTDLITPGRRIDVPLERLVATCRCNKTRPTTGAPVLEEIQTSTDQGVRTWPST